MDAIIKERSLGEVTCSGKVEGPTKSSECSSLYTTRFAYHEFQVGVCGFDSGV
jgi:hypothetical protein